MALEEETCGFVVMEDKARVPDVIDLTLPGSTTCKGYLSTKTFQDMAMSLMNFLGD